MLLAYAEFSLEVSSDSPVAVGTYVIFNVTLIGDDGKIAPNKKYQFSYEFSGGSKAIETSSPSIQIQIQADHLEHGHYRVDFLAEEYFYIVYIEKARISSYFDVTNRFMGDLELVQEPNSTIREDGFVSSQYETIHNVIISEKDKKLLDKAAYIRIYWFVDCLYMGEFKFHFFVTQTVSQLLFSMEA